MDVSYERQFLIAWLITILVETPLLVLCFQFQLAGSDNRPPLRRLIAASVFSSSATLPLLWFVWPAWIDSASAWIVSGELFAVAAEGAFYWIFLACSFTRAMLISFACNLTSFLTGLMYFGYLACRIVI